MMSKTCFKCGAEKSVEEFYRHPAMGDGRLGKCKECTKKDVQSNYRKNHRKYREYEKRRSETEHRKRMVSIYQKRIRKNNPCKSKAWNAVSNALRDGKLFRKSCEACGNPKTEAHHDDYSKPLDVRWLCFKCHRELCHGQVLG